MKRVAAGNYARISPVIAWHENGLTPRSNDYETRAIAIELFHYPYYYSSITRLKEMFSH